MRNTVGKRPKTSIGLKNQLNAFKKKKKKKSAEFKIFAKKVESYFEFDVIRLV